jgi:glucosamine-phosphate N-acetyltransferase
MNITTSRLQKKYFAEVLTLLQDVSIFHPPSENLDTIWQSLQKQPNAFLIQATHESALVGFGSLVTATRARGGKVGYIEDIVTHPAFRRRGVGEIIINTLSDIARAEGCYKITLQCENNKIDFYKKLSFSETENLTMQILLT